MEGFSCEFKAAACLGVGHAWWALGPCGNLALASDSLCSDVIIFLQGFHANVFLLEVKLISMWLQVEIEERGGGLAYFNDLGQHEAPAYDLGSSNLSGDHNSHCQIPSSEIVWSGTVWTCGKQLRHYPSFSRNGITIAVHSFVFVMGKGENHYLAYLEDMYEDKRGQKKVKVRWFHYSEEVKVVTPIKNPHAKEVFITQCAQVISAECVDGPASILSREHFSKCCCFVSCTAFQSPHVLPAVQKQPVKPFDLTKLRGYFNQPILSCLFLSPMQKPDSEWNGQNSCEDNELTSGDDVKVGGKRAKTSRGDSGIRGCWFRCTILRVAHRQLRVRYDDVKDEDGIANIEEWIPAMKIARPDKLGMRFSRRLTIRPIPHPLTKQNFPLTLDGSGCVWSDGWWEGVVMELTTP
ncbi:hypothetical protein MLD38_012762 [Melastoma candidum]|uniref:Uncharacterized protein n=1 Tax=Melastoma candidum TaxID=119954 RepID=A0ACB9RFT4_9MYRT|nr:hypothetical protein MLD38_012762 [Melastoma candidum]